jgi:hypothetical protein
VSFRFLKAVMSAKMPAEPASSSGSWRYGRYLGRRRQSEGFDNLPATRCRAEFRSWRRRKGLGVVWKVEGGNGAERCVVVLLFSIQKFKAGSLLRRNSEYLAWPSAGYDT